MSRLDPLKGLRQRRALETQRIRSKKAHLVKRNSTSSASVSSVSLHSRGIEPNHKNNKMWRRNRATRSHALCDSREIHINPLRPKMTSTPPGRETLCCEEELVQSHCRQRWPQLPAAIASSAPRAQRWVDRSPAAGRRVVVNEENNTS